MYVTAQMIAKEVGLSAKTIMAHVRKAEKIGWNVRRRIGKPAMINYENFMAYVNGEELDDFKKRKTICDWMSSGGDHDHRNGGEHGDRCDQLQSGSMADDLVTDSRSVVLQWNQAGRNKSS
jgi:hypothetical protein